jgi:hypothetical protein
MCASWDAWHICCSISAGRLTAVCHQMGPLLVPTSLTDGHGWTVFTAKLWRCSGTRWPCAGGGVPLQVRFWCLTDGGQGCVVCIAVPCRSGLPLWQSSDMQLSALSLPVVKGDRMVAVGTTPAPTLTDTCLHPSACLTRCHVMAPLGAAGSASAACGGSLLSLWCVKECTLRRATPQIRPSGPVGHSMQCSLRSSGV